MRQTHTAIAALLIVALAAPLAAAKPARPRSMQCDELLAKAEATWVEDGQVEVGTLAGLINGGFYLRYDDSAKPVAHDDAKANLVIPTKRGDILLWVGGESILNDDGGYTRKLVTLHTDGTGAYAAAKIDITVSGSFYPGKGGTYDLIGTICTPVRLQGQK